jgi:hypothetical protein
LSAALEPRRAPRAVHDPGKIVADLATALALGWDCLADIAVLREQPELADPARQPGLRTRPQTRHKPSAEPLRPARQPSERSRLSSMSRPDGMIEKHLQSSYPGTIE